MADFGELVLVLGDLHIPSRANELPDAFKELLVPGKMQHILCTGNLVNKHTEEYLRTLANSVHIVKGDCDVTTSLVELPESKVIRIGDFTIGLIHGHQIIPWGDPNAAQSVQRSLNCDILISGHTHKNEVVEIDGKYFVNPGSATGAANVQSEAEITPSFVLMAVKGKSVTTFVYELVDGKVSVRKSEFTKH